MRCSFIVSVIAFTLISCSSNTEIDFDQHFPQKWQLMSMSGNIANVPPISGDDLPYQEYYLLFSDILFIKSRDQDGVITEETGKFSFLTFENGKYLELVYEQDNDLIGNCSIETKELLKLIHKNELMGTWRACDGPGLIYSRTE